ncbi:MAG: DNA translocase FtsK [Oscillospiraceae bacterium]|nr:DNA translocase FtsK [Oscillospiraceae bacterium]
MYIAIMIAADKSQNAVITKLMQGILLILLFSGLAQILVAGDVEGKTALLKIKGLYRDGINLKGGGLLSAIFGWSLLAAFKKVGATIIIILLTIIFFLLLSNLTLVQLFSGITKPFRKAGSAVKNAIDEDRNERNQRQEAAAEKEPKPEKESKKEKRVDIAKYYVEDEDEDTGYEGFATIDELEHSEELDIILPPRPFGPKPKKKSYFDEMDNFEKMNEPSKEQKKEAEKASQTELEAKQMQELIDRSTEDFEVPEIAELIEEEPEGEEIFVENDGQSSLLDKEKIKKEKKLPPVTLLTPTSNKSSAKAGESESQQKAVTLVETLKSFGVQTRVIGIHRGPSVTRFELQPAAGVKVSKITGLADDIALNLAAQGVRIEAPIPGKAAVGIELANTNRDKVSIRELIDSDEFRDAKGKLNFVVGKNIEGGIVVGDISKMPHVLIAGTTGSGKSVFTNSIIMNILYRATSDEVKLLLIDPKQVEFPIYNGIPHLISPVITEPRKAAGALGWAVTEMLRRYKLFADNSVRDLIDYNEQAQEQGYDKLAQIVIVIDELADLMMAASKEVEDSICRLAQLARAAGMHLIIATQSPRVDVVTGLIKANFPSRVALKVSNNTDSRIILDEGGAEKLLGNGDLLYKPVGLGKPMRIQGSFVSTAEIRAVVKFLKDNESAEYDDEVLEGIEKNIPVPKGEKPQGAEIDTGAPKSDDMFEEAMRIVVETKTASTSFLQRKLSLGYARAARIMDDLENAGVVGPAVGAKPRQVLMTREQWLEREATRE